MTKMQILDAIIGGTGMVMINDSVGIYRGKLSDYNKKLLLGILLTSIGGVQMGVRCVNPDFIWFKDVYKRQTFISRKEKKPVLRKRQVKKRKLKRTWMYATLIAIVITLSSLTRLVVDGQKIRNSILCS